MDLEKLEYYEFLDLSDIDEDERQQLKQTLFTDGTLDFLQLPWTSQYVPEEWQKECYGGEITSVPNGPSDLSSPPPSELVGQDPGGGATMPPQMQPVAMYTSPAMPAYTMPPPSTGYQQPQNMFVSNVTANVHGYMTGHYVQPHYSMPEPEMSGRGHRGRGRSRGNKRNDCRMDNNMVETTTNQPYAPQYVNVPIQYHPAYYTQPMGSPMQHPNAQAASPLYITPMYTPMYSAYPPPGPQYYPQPPAHVNAVMDDMPDMSDLNLEHHPQGEPVYQHQLSEEDYDTSQNVVTKVIVNSNIEQNCEMKPSNIVFLNNNDVKLTEDVILDTHKPVSVMTHVQPSLVTVRTEPALVKISANVTKKLEKNDVINVVNTDSVPLHIQETDTNAVTVVPKVVCPQPPPVVETTPVHNNVITPTEPITVVSNTKVAASPPQEMSTVKPITQESASAAPPGKSWASLFNKLGSTQETSTTELPKVNSKPLSSSKMSDEKQTGKKGYDSKFAYHNLSIFTNDPVSHRMGEFLSKCTLDNRTVSLQPRGLTNRSNYCYINSILQALLACPPFYNLLKALPHQPRKSSTGKSPTPIIDSMVEFVNEFMPLPAGARLNRKEKGQRKDDNFDMSCGPAFEPSWIYKILNGIRSDTFIVEGRQEDAEEFFGCLLNGLNDEMLELMKLVEGDTQQNNNNLSNGDIVPNGETHEQDEVEWKVMGPKNKGSITRRAEFDRTPISDIFRGQLRSRVHRTGDQVTDNVQPFFTLQLDIEKVTSVYEALEVLVHKDKLEGVTCSKTNQQVEAWQQVTFEELPLVMVLHLKCFNYKLDVCSKIIKALEFPIDLKIDSKLLSPKVKCIGKQKQYKLFAIVYHDGKEASKGHYLTDAYHVGYGGWVRYDDSTVKPVIESKVLHPNAARVPYLLFYRRCDTIGNQLNIKKD